MSNLATIVNNILADSGIDDINVVVTTGSYSNPAWITALGWSKITGTPTTIAGYGITNAYTKTEVDTLLNAKQNTLTLTTTGTSGAATLVGATLNIPQYQAALTNPVTGSGNNNYIAKFTSTGSTIGNSLLQSTASNVFIFQEDTSFGIDAQASTRIGFTKKGGAQPFLSYATDPFTIRSSSGVNIDASNTFATQFSMAIDGVATFSNKIVGNAILQINGGTDPNDTSAAYFWNAAGIGPSISGLKFQVRTGATQTTRLFVTDLGYVGVNTVTPQSNFVVSNDAGTQSIEINQLTTRGRIFSIDRSTSTWLPLYINDSGGNVIIGSTSNNGSLFQAYGEATFGSGVEKISMTTQSLGFNRRVSNGDIYDSSAFAYQFQHTQSTSSGSDYLALQVYNRTGGNVTVSSWAVNGNGNMIVGGTGELMGGERLTVIGSSNTAILAQFTGGGTVGWAAKFWNNGTTGNNLITEFLTESSVTPRGSIRYDRTGNRLNIVGEGSGLLFTGAPTFSSLAGTGSRIVVADANGTLTASSALSGYVPYTGANQNVNLGANSLQVNQKIGTTDNQGIFLRGIGDATHKIYYKDTIPANIWEANADILFQNYNSGSPFTIFTFSTGGNLTAIGSVNGNGAKPQLTANGGSSAGAQISLNTSLSTNPTLRRNWALVTEDQVEGDFAIKSSTSAGGAPTATRLSILRDSMVGINMTTPIYQLDVTTANYKSFRIQSSDDALITMGSTIAASQFYSIGVSSATSGQGANLFWIGTSTNNPSGTLTKNFTLSAAGVATVNTGAIGSGLSLDVNNSGTYGLIGVRRGTQTNASAGINYYTTTTQRWFTGMYESTDNFGIYSVGTAGFPLVLNYSSGDATFSSSVGIGVSPLTKLHLQGSSPNYILLTNTGADGVQNAIQGGIIGQARGYSNNLSQMASILFRNKNTAAWYKGEITFNTNDIDGTDPSKSPVERMRISSDGKVGIGTVSPEGALDVVGDLAYVGNANASTFVVRNNGSFTAGGGSSASMVLQYGGQNIVTIANTGTGQRDSVFTMRDEGVAKVVIAANNSRGGDTYFNGGGKVGIGTASPTDKLDVVGEVVFGAQTEKLSMGSASLAWNRKVATGLIYDNTRFAYQFQHTGSTSSASDYLALQVYNNSGGGVTSTAFVVNGNGNTLLGTGVDNGHRLRVDGSVFASGYMYTASEGTGFVVDANPNASLARVGLMKYGGFEGMLVSGASTVVRLGHRLDSEYVLAGGTPNIRVDMTIAASGAAIFGNSVTATSFFESSDSRIKTELEDILDYEAIANVGAKYYEKNGKAEIGYFAQDFESILPSAISVGEDGFLNLSYREVHTAKIAMLEKKIIELEQQLKNK